MPETLTELTHALKHLSWELDTQDAKLRSEAFTSDANPRPIDHELRKEVRDWVEKSLERTQNGSRPTLPPLSPGIDRFLEGRAGSKNPITPEAARLDLTEAESMARQTAYSITIRNEPGGQRREGDKAKIKEVMTCWGGSV
jgi:hypothetical protein